MKQQTNLNDTQDPVRSSFGDDPDFQELLEMFQESLQETVGELRGAHETGNIAQLQKDAHKLKGAGGGYGFEELSQKAAALEEACKANDLDQVCQTLESLLGYADRIVV